MEGMKRMDKSNSIGKILAIIGFVQILGGFILGMILGQDDTSYSSDFSWVLALPWWIGGFVTGMLFIGFAEVIELLHSLNEKKENNQHIGQSQIAATTTEVKEMVKYNEEEVPRNFQLRIMDYYEKKGQTVVNFIKTPFEKYVYIELNIDEDNFRLVHMELFTVREVPRNEWKEDFTKWVGNLG
jgi:flagellar basal body-associated protein FliL